MNRAGVDNLKDLNTLACFINNSKWLMLDGMFSHFACPENKKQLKSAQNKFLLANNLIKGYNIRANCHISASGGFLKGVFGDLVRIGLLLYGYKPFESDFCEVNPIPVKEALNIMGLEVGPCRMPLCKMDPKNAERLTNALKGLNII